MSSWNLLLSDSDRGRFNLTFDLVYKSLLDLAQMLAVWFSDWRWSDVGRDSAFDAAAAWRR